MLGLQCHNNFPRATLFRTHLCFRAWSRGARMPWNQGGSRGWQAWNASRPPVFRTKASPVPRSHRCASAATRSATRIPGRMTR